jgi:hypothetical protein
MLGVAVQTSQTRRVVVLVLATMKTSAKFQQARQTEASTVAKLIDQPSEVAC